MSKWTTQAERQANIDRARDHYEARRDRRKLQSWRRPDGHVALIGDGHVEGCEPEKGDGR